MQFLHEPLLQAAIRATRTGTIPFNQALVTVVDNRLVILPGGNDPTSQITFSTGASAAADELLLTTGAIANLQEYILWGGAISNTAQLRVSRRERLIW